ncbi:MAG: DNA mismatch repair endonuclease MutL [Flavobacteriaceae bacterium]
MADIIQLLPDHVANQIAAGEVVQRPASVVKELLENAIDAGASEITLVLKDAGKTLVQVIDNGVGMSVTDARLCFERHATSKIKNAEDLFNLHTKGFRGEALASIAAIAHVELKTKTETSETGTKIEMEGSKVISQEMVVAPKGTTISVKNLFYNIPARRNFLKSNPVETRHIIDEFHRVALAHPQVAFEMIHNGSNVFSLPSSNLRQRIVNIFGSKTNEKLVPVTEETDIVKVHGFVLKPEFSRKSRGEQFFFVNDRFIKSAYLHHAVASAFEGLIKTENHPGYFLYLEVAPHAIDINIHPTKTEIKFEDEHAIYTMLRSTIKHSLGQFSIAPVLDFNRDAGFDTPYEYSKKSPVIPSIEVDKDFNPFQKEAKQNPIAFPFQREKQKAWESLYVGLDEDFSENRREADFSSNFEIETEEVSSSLFENQQAEKGTITFQIQNKYIVSAIKSGLMVVHQNLAHQRILYEEILKNITLHQAVSQQLLFPISFQFSKSKVAMLQSLQEQLEDTGFVFSEIKGERVAISGVPSGVLESGVEDILQQLIADVETEIPEAGYSRNDVLAKSLAKSMAIKTGVSLSVAAQENMINQLFACKEPSVSPENRPVLITLGMADFDKKFM